MRHEWRAVIQEQLERLSIGEVTLATPDTTFQLKRVRTELKHVLIVVAFQKCGMTLCKVLRNVIARKADIGENAHRNGIACHHKVVRIVCIVRDWKCRNGYLTHLHRLIRAERIN